MVRDRSRARAWMVQVLYAWEAAGCAVPLMAVLETTLAKRNVAPRRVPYIRRVIAVLADRLDEIDRALRDALENWRLERLASVDRQILRVGAAEILYLDEIPPRVSIQEAIRLAEKYGSDQSVRFVNGVLDALLRRVQAAG
ncbi:MAG: transcription antitermination factor NusB [Gemmatimonadetes bacterium]|nr:transcription antitermination factor NusB [Gemmatimonadota bacterium]